MNKKVAIARFILFLLIAAWLIYACCNAWRRVKPLERTPEQVMEDTLKITTKSIE